MSMRQKIVGLRESIRNCDSGQLATEIIREIDRLPAAQQTGLFRALCLQALRINMEWPQEEEGE